MHCIHPSTSCTAPTRSNQSRYSDQPETQRGTCFASLAALFSSTRLGPSLHLFYAPTILCTASSSDAVRHTWPFMLSSASTSVSRVACPRSRLFWAFTSVHSATVSTTTPRLHRNDSVYRRLLRLLHVSTRLLHVSRLVSACADPNRRGFRSAGNSYRHPTRVYFMSAAPTLFGRSLYTSSTLSTHRDRVCTPLHLSSFRLLFVHIYQHAINAGRPWSSVLQHLIPGSLPRALTAFHFLPDHPSTLTLPYFIGLSLLSSFSFSLYSHSQSVPRSRSSHPKVSPTCKSMQAFLRTRSLTSVRMSLAPYTYRPITPPEAAAGQRGHRRNISNISNASSCYFNYTNDTSPESIITNNTTPSRSPALRQYGPTLLPKIRTQDSGSTPPSAGQAKVDHRRGSWVNNASHFGGPPRPLVYRSSTEPVECTTLMSPISNAPRSRAASVAPSPGYTHANLHRTKNAHARSGSASSIDSSILSRYGYPTYRQTPVFNPIQQQTPSPALFAQDYMSYQNTDLLDPPMINLEGTLDFPIDIECLSRPASISPPPQTFAETGLETSSLLDYLVQPTQPINLVRHLNPGPGRGTVNHFWWDVRNLRTWDSFSVSTFSMIPDLMTLLNFQHETATLHSYNAPGTALQTATPANETDLTNLVTKMYFPRANAAALHSLGGPNSIALYAAPQSTVNQGSSPNFLANYPSDGDRTLSGIPRGRVVGISRSFDKWNTGMRREGPARRVEYLKGLAHLQKCMRDHSCRYGFIITEIELLCVRAGCDDRGMPYFGYLELAEAIPTKTSLNISTEEHIMDGGEVPMTASLALYFLLMLAKQHPLPGQASSFMDVGASGALTRQRTWDGMDLDDEERGKDGKDKWIPEPQMGEKREAKTVRGWVWPSDPWHKREGGGGKRRG